MCIARKGLQTSFLLCNTVVKGQINFLGSLKYDVPLSSEMNSGLDGLNVRTLSRGMLNYLLCVYMPGWAIIVSMINCTLLVSSDPWLSAEVKGHSK